LVTRLDKKLTSEYQRKAAELRAAGIGAELYVGNQNIGKQFKYAADTGKAVAIVMGSNELERREVAVKDLRLGEELARDIGPDRARWLKDQPAQYNVARALLAEAVEHILQRRPGRPPESR
ncbi:MAG: His/Gly/Thr/Pro-type tRNA ligase C-terminal domain-containing protein, partial [Myxococcota bacterium]